MAVVPVVVMVVLAASDAAQGDLFGAPPPLGVPAGDVFGWVGGVVPETVRKALRREIRRRGLRQEDAAADIGISRPQLANILQRRFGASHRSSDRIRSFLLAEAVTVKAGRPGGHQ